MPERHGKRGRAVDMAGTEARVVHAYDDIEEYDNELPNWWLYTLFGAMVFALGYYFWYEVLHAGPSQQQTYEASRVEDRRRDAERARRLGAMNDDGLRTLSHDAATVEQGRALYVQNCVACHRADGGGLIGPNLTDNQWIHGGEPLRVFRTVSEGVAAKGMPAWGAQLGPDRTMSVVAYLLTLRNTNVAAGKAPQGDVYAGN
jgi:cytochrome c oxidase cbb3-type subunit 3